jgi:hypothetical protein
VVARHFGLDNLVTEKAAGWEALHAQKVLDMQLRSSDRRTYLGSWDADNSEDKYQDREEWVAVHAAMSWMVKWIDAQGAFSLSTAFVPVVIDNNDREFNVTGPWETDSVDDAMGWHNVYHEGGGASGSRRAEWKEQLPAGHYRVSAWWSEYPNHSTSVPYTIFRTGGSTTVHVDQRDGGGQWNVLGDFDFDGTDATGFVQLWNQTTGYVVADGVMFQKLW